MTEQEEVVTKAIALSEKILWRIQQCLGTTYTKRRWQAHGHTGEERNQPPNVEIIINQKYALSFACATGPGDAPSNAVLTLSIQNRKQNAFVAIVIRTAEGGMLLEIMCEGDDPDCHEITQHIAQQVATTTDDHVCLVCIQIMLDAFSEIAARN